MNPRMCSQSLRAFVTAISLTASPGIPSSDGIVSKATNASTREKTPYLAGPSICARIAAVANVIAADGFAGERERKTLEPLLYTPATDAELFVAKLLAAWIPAVMIAFGGAFIYAVLVNVTAWPVMQRVFFPDLTWTVMVLWMAPAFAALGLAGMLLVSLRVRGMQEATQLGGLFVLPVIALVVGEVRGAILLGPLMAVAIGLVVWAIAGALLLFGVKRFKRTSLVGKL